MRNANAAAAGSSRIMAFVDSTYWAMHTGAYLSFRSILERWDGRIPDIPRAQKDQAILQAQQSTQASRDGVSTYVAPSTIAVMSLYGCISPRSGMVDDISQEGTCLDTWGARYKKAMTDPNIAATVTLHDSPGGNVQQVQETADLIYSLRGNKPNVGIVMGMSASADFWLATQHSELVCSPSSECGSIGVLMRHEDISKMLEDMGVIETFIESPSGGNKSEGNPFTTLSEDSIQYLTGRCDEYYQAFLSGLSRGRNVKTKAIDQDWGRGRMVSAKTALSLGMVDRISTLQQEIDKMAQRVAGKKGGARAEGDGAMEIEAAAAAVAVESAAVEPIDKPEDQTRTRALHRLRLA